MLKCRAILALSTLEDRCLEVHMVRVHMMRVHMMRVHMGEGAHG